MEMIDIETEHRVEENASLLKSDGGVLGDEERKLVKSMPVKIVAGNKCDLKADRKISARQGLNWARRRGCGFMETSAREVVNIEETFARTCGCSFSITIPFTSTKALQLKGQST